MRYLKIFIICIFLIFAVFLKHTYAAETSKVFASSDGLPYHSTDYNNAVQGFTKLGYNIDYSGICDGKISKDGTNGIMSYIRQSSNNYGFYISTHGDFWEDSQECYFQDYAGNRIWPSEIRGNWHFVFIDACWSKKNDSLVNAFNITSSSRAYLGWYGEPGARDTRDFCDYFWNTYVNTMPIQRAAQKAAVDVPGSGTTPIRFSGDTSWYGRAN